MIMQIKNGEVIKMADLSDYYLRMLKIRKENIDRFAILADLKHF